METRLQLLHARSAQILSQVEDRQDDPEVQRLVGTLSARMMKLTSGNRADEDFEVVEREMTDIEEFLKQ